MTRIWYVLMLGLVGILFFAYGDNSFTSMLITGTNTSDVFIRFGLPIAYATCMILVLILGGKKKTVR